MRKAHIVALIVVFALLFGVVPVRAQIFSGQYGPADQLLRSNLDTVDRWMWYDDMYGFMRGSQFYGLYGRDGRRLSRPVKVAIVGGMIGGAIGGSRWGTKGAVIGSIAGAVPGLLVWAFRDDNDNDGERMVGLPDQIPPMPQQQMPPGRENDWNKRLRDQRYGNQSQGPAPVVLEWQMLRNEFQGVTIYARVQGLDPSQPIVISPSQTVSVQIPQGAQIWAEALICLDENCTVQRWRQDVGRRPLPQGAGWVFYNPEEGR